ncbi:ProQ/FINO family protein [Arsenophonus nasoniae]|uniref:ProQ/FINO family protein n=1 Tax=Arsenophonus nasoniae TaxID=638 RepID=A0AA95KFA9_9GAMM|nr:ProQ/FINO family protein [Arsenophonus nasoniae]WGM04073.1 ProQ/FINO family protein [Arsenophonus nasoniae]
MTEQKRPILIIKGKRGSKVSTLESAVKPTLKPNNKAPIAPKTEKKQKAKKASKTAKVKQEPPKPITKEEKAARHAAKLKAAVDILVTLFPKVFNFESPKPLKVGIGKDIRKMISEKGLDIPNSQISTGLMAYTQTEAYQKSLVEFGSRFNLDGLVDGEVTDKQRERAKKKLNELQASK